MLDEDLHIDLPEAEVTAFFQAELRHCLTKLRKRRLLERMDGSLTAGKARRNRLVTQVLHGMVEDGIREEIPEERLHELDPGDHDLAAELQKKLFRKLISPSFNQEIQTRAAGCGMGGPLSEGERLQLRWAALEANAAAHAAVAEVPLHQAGAARDAAVKLLKGMAAGQIPSLAETSGSAESRSAPQVKASLPVQAAVAESPERQDASSRPAMTTADVVTPGVAIIKGRITGAAVMAQKIQAENQPEDERFYGMAENARTDVQHGADLFGTAVRMIRGSRSKAGTKAQKLKSVALFIFVTGMQRV